MTDKTVDEEVEVVGYRVSLESEPELGLWFSEDAESEPQYCTHEPLMTVTQHQRLLEEARQGQRVLAMEVEQLKDEVCRLQDDLNEMTADRNGCAHQRDQLKAELATAWSNAEKNARDCDDLRAQLTAQTVVLPERVDYQKTLYEGEEYQIGWNACLDELARLNKGAKP